MAAEDRRNVTATVTAETMEDRPRRSEVAATTTGVVEMAVTAVEVTVLASARTVPSKDTRIIVTIGTIVT